MTQTIDPNPGKSIDLFLTDIVRGYAKIHHPNLHLGNKLRNPNTTHAVI